jgi:transglutaminase-like putative cysteine protease
MAEHDIIGMDVPQDEYEDSKKKPLRLILALVLVFIMVISFIPYYYIQEDPHPKEIPSFDDVVPGDLQAELGTQNTIQAYEDINYFINPDDPLVKTVSTRVATFGCGSEKLCQAKSIYFFVQQNFVYVSESDEFFQTFDQALVSRGGDCDDATILLANMYKAIGIPVQVIFIKNHVFLEIYIEDAPRRYKNSEGWIFVDGTCYSCGFGEIPADNRDEARYYVRV